MIEIREKGEERRARQHVAISRQSWWGVEGAGHKVLTYVCRVQSSVWRLPKYWPPTHSLTLSAGGEGGGGQYFGRRQTLDLPLSMGLGYSSGGW
jgi:hypothetical protein